MSPTKEIKVVVGVRRSSMSSSCGSSGYYSSSPTLSSSPPVLCNPKSGNMTSPHTHTHTHTYVYIECSLWSSSLCKARNTRGVKKWFHFIFRNHVLVYVSALKNRWFSSSYSLSICDRYWQPEQLMVLVFTQCIQVSCIHLIMDVNKLVEKWRWCGRCFVCILTD